MSSELVFYVNQSKVVVRDPSPEDTVLSYLRRERGCGACTVMVSRVADRTSRRIEHLAVNACLAPLVTVHGTAVTTIEGIASGGLHPLQERLVKAFGSQCGFCTPGIIMSAYALLRTQPEGLCQRQMDTALQGNLCRCTGYRPILEALGTFTCCGGSSERCCRSKEVNEESGFKADDCLPYDSSQEPIFPNELQLQDAFDSQELEFRSAQVVWFRPTSLQRLLELKSLHPQAKLMTGNTELGIEVHNRKEAYPIYIQITHIPEINFVKFEAQGLTIGAATTLTTIDQACRNQIDDPSIPENHKRFTQALVEMLHWFGGPQIRNVATIGGNIMTASPISDIVPLLMAAGATMKFRRAGDDETNLRANNNFFVGYRKTDAHVKDVLVSIFIPYMKQNEFFYGFKQGRRREDDIAIVNAGMRVLLDSEGDTIKDAAMAFGGIAATTKLIETTTKEMVGMKWDLRLTEKVVALLEEEIEIAATAPGGQVAYRKTLVASLFHRFFNLVSRDIGRDEDCWDSSALTWIQRAPSSGTQVYDLPADGQLKSDPVGRPVVHRTAFEQATGEAVYVDDIPEYTNELFMVFVFSKVARAKISDIDYSMALEIPGVVGVVDRRDVQSSNDYGDFGNDERAFADGEVRTVGEIIAGVLARDRRVAKEAAAKVKVTYSDIQTPVITIGDAIQRNEFYETPLRLQCGDAESAFRTAVHVVDGDIHIGGQEHFYVEPQSALINPKEGGEIEAFLTAQSPSYSQSSIAKILGVSQSRVNVRVKRLGGGFGGKEMRNMVIAAPCAVAARKFRRPVRVVLDRDEDMSCSGTRHPVYARYRLAADESGRFVAWSGTYYLNAGYSMCLSACVARRCIWACSTGYTIPNIDVNAKLCKTNTPSNTAFRAFGAPQAGAVIERAICEMAEKTGLSQGYIREINLMKNGDLTTHGQILENSTMQRCWFECKQLADYDKRVGEVETFNKTSKYKKKGVMMAPVCYNIGLSEKFLHKGGALVNIYTDGSVLVTHGGVEMGQGLHTKLIQVASRVLNISMDKIFISETSTDKVPNTAPSAASITTDLNGPAVMDACQQLKDRLSHFMHTNPKGTWEEWVLAAYLEGVDLSAKGYFNASDISYDHDTLKGNPFAYAVYGGACAEVELDTLTGDHVVHSVEIVMDLGASLNPAIDVGQIEGAFVQGYGLYTLEEERHTPVGQLLTRGPGAYKIPGFGDIPERFRVHILKGSLNTYKHAVYSSKAVGEPPLCLAVSVYTALRQAAASARDVSAGQLHLDSPATSERLRLAVGDNLVFKNLQSSALRKGDKPWAVLLSDAS